MKKIMFLAVILLVTSFAAQAQSFSWCTDDKISETVTFNDETGVMEVVIKTARPRTPQQVAKAMFTYEVDASVPGPYQELVRYEEHGVTMGWQKNSFDQASVHITVTAPVIVIAHDMPELDGRNMLTLKLLLSKEQVEFLRSFNGIGKEYFFYLYPIKITLV